MLPNIFFSDLRGTLMEKENLLSKTRQELEDLHDYKVSHVVIAVDFHDEKCITKWKGKITSTSA